MSTPDNRSVNFFSLFRRGQHYSKTWPLEKRLAPVFVENRVIKMTRYAIRFMPPIAVFTLCWQIALVIRLAFNGCQHLSRLLQFTANFIKPVEVKHVNAG